MLAEIAPLGVGIGWRLEIADKILAHKPHVDFVEIISEHYLNVTPEKLAQVERLSRQFPVIPHGIDLSIGTDTPIEDEYLDGLSTLCELVDAPWFSDHLCFTRVPGYSIGQLTVVQISGR